jgi:hypothetical protein
MFGAGPQDDVRVSVSGCSGHRADGQDDKYYTLETVAVGAVNLEARRLSWDVELLASLPEVLPQQSPLGNKARALANKIMNTFDGTLDSARECRQLAEDVMGKGWQEDANKQTGQEEGTLWALGYCHIDTAWYVAVTILRKQRLTAGYGHGAQPSKKSPEPGQVKSRYPTDTPSSDSLPRQLNITNG